MGKQNDFRARTVASLRIKGLKEKSYRNAWTGHVKGVEAAAAVPEWQELRQRARDIKLHTLDHLDTYLEEFADNVEKNGGHVCFASTGKEALDYVLDVARRHGVDKVAKGKSMASEELHLNAVLEEAGIQPVETDLGEYIVQLSGEPPSHIITPVMHMSRQEIGELFARELGIEYTENPQKLTAVARGILRGQFLTAPMGFSGGNFLVAETGSLVLVENEGNIRLSTSLPKVHVALIGMEKVIPKLRDLAVFLRLLPRTGTGQKMTGYASILSGPRRAGEVDGPEEFHVVLLDNGRSKILADPHKRQILSCIRCGACLNACPVYRTVCGHGYDSVYPGPIGKLLGPHAVGTDHGEDLPSGSSLCGACTEVCPAKIDIAHLLLHLRSESVRAGGDDLLWRAGFSAWAEVTQRPQLYRAAAAMAKLGKAALDRTVGEESVPPPVSGWTQSRKLPPFARRSFDQWWKDTDGGKNDE
jgi:L-lactate dehydrogenase complex protein LldF